jgi:glycosyltransferase involved in cell wall biosynthesis
MYMRIAIDARSVNWYKGTGIGTYTDNVLKQLLKLDTQNYYHIYWSGNDYNSYKNENSKTIMTSRRHKKFFQQYYFPNNLKKENIDIFHIPQNGIGLNTEVACKKVITIHDLIPYVMPETVGTGYLSEFLREVPKLIESSQGILTVSEKSKQDILKFFPISENKIFVTPLAADTKYRPLDKENCKSLVKKRFNIEKPFILYLGGFSSRKNISSLIIAFSKLNKDLKEGYNLVIVGSLKDESANLIKLSMDLNMDSNIIFTNFVEEALLPILYNAAAVFVYPSLYEGFGLPPLEAMNCGTPVIASNCSSIPEVVQDAGILIDPKDTSSLISALDKVLSSVTIQKSLSQNSLKKASEFSWENTAKNTLKAYKTIYEKDL